MAESTDARALAFNAEAFRDAIHFVMAMGKPDPVHERVRFGWRVERGYASGADAAGRPYDWTATPTSTSAPTLVEVPVAMEFIPRTSADRTEPGIGEFSPSQVTLTILDTDFPAVATADFVEIDGRQYEIISWEAPYALFSVEVYTCHARAHDLGGS